MTSSEMRPCHYLSGNDRVKNHRFLEAQNNKMMEQVNHVEWWNTGAKYFDEYGELKNEVTKDKKDVGCNS